jgi:hypothetical protein
MRSRFYLAPEPKVLKPEDVALYLGKRGTKKSRRAKELAERCMSSGQRVLALDPHDEWSVHGQESDQVVLGPLRTRYEAWEVLGELSLLEDPELCAAIVPGSRDPEEWAQSFVPIIDMALDVGDVTLFLEEMGTWGQYCVKQLNALALNSRHSRVAVVGISQRAYLISPTFRSQATHINSGLQTEPRDLAALEEVAGKDFAEAVRQLERGKWCHWRDDTGAPRPSPSRKQKP